MIMRFRLLLLLLLSVVLTACASTNSEEKSSGNEGIHNQAYPDVEQILKKDENADVFQWKKRIYKTNLKSLESMDVTKEKQIGTIESTYSEGDEFTDNMATKLPAGTAIYATDKENILIAEHNGETKRYLAMIED
ncbi:hypothetical protein ERJ70_02810 [Sediminibacillus dalangtanensis]|uniref:Uncharacterized protein n=1 Tax=Sediminibacillus dalangtanensis TaxID=2729421 RepID=A0ABX7VRW4_9BACI|nr:hypothetical protein [Sediminibacillus dalangtanensis]QTM98340.1 hypothetical protein ERJ70_02810 [Sediminibacillus dalangtanensis]